MVLGGLNDLEAKIAALEAALQHDAPASENSEDESSDGDGQGTEESEDELPTIPPLPLSCLPPPKSSEIVVKPDGTIKKQRRKKKKSLFEDEDDGTKDAHEGEEVFFSCEICGVQFRKGAELNAHRRTPEHQKAVKEALAKETGGTYSNEGIRRSMFCRLCEMSFDTKEELEEHRLTASHKEHARRERELSFCAACNKSFTSPEQLQEHCKGKWHLLRAAGNLPQGRGKGRQQENGDLLSRKGAGKAGGRFSGSGKGGGKGNQKGGGVVKGGAKGTSTAGSSRKRPCPF
ncbi:hypothetical protein CYMTET_37776 [Cymbomonas tetramitiformis]|uniref:C2H2-type domain-containing protein n=1 Tax=Cymbomonas tetramitiformis TaxID=36881 RepID=A0AAE0CF15_9CHLO|nr:hypothetical protein CYMTET_37776 [Cymbomonas tetramitiformis]